MMMLRPVALLIVLVTAVVGVRTARAETRTRKTLKAVALRRSGQEELKIGKKKEKSLESIFPDQPAVRMLVVASWCKYSIAVLKALEEDREFRSKFDLIVFDRNELSDAIEYALAKGEISEAQAREYRRAAKGKVLAFPEDVPGSLVVHAVSSDDMRAIARGFPSIVDCTDSRCQIVETGPTYRQLATITSAAK